MKMPDLARSLGISLTHAYRLAHLGMPTDSAESARRWRAVNLDPARVHGGRADRPAKAPPPPAMADDERDLDHVAVWIALRFAPERLPSSVACWVNNGGFPDFLRGDLLALMETIRECLERLDETTPELEDVSCKLLDFHL